MESHRNPILAGASRGLELFSSLTMVAALLVGRRLRDRAKNRSCFHAPVLRVVLRNFGF